MNHPVNEVAYILTVIWVSIAGLFGASLMFARPENIERNWLVGGLTVISAMASGVVLALKSFQPFTNFALLMLCIVGVSGFVLGKAIDLLLGPKPLSAEQNEATYGIDLAD